MHNIGGIWHRQGKLIEPSLIERFSQLHAINPAHKTVIQTETNWLLCGCQIQHKIPDTQQALTTQQINAQSNSHIVSDTRLDNKPQLIKQLRIKEQQIDDAQLIQLAYQKWQQDCVEYLSGNFAFCLWDKTKQQLFFARDRLGIKPLYYAEHNDYFIFSSQVKCIAESGLIPKQINKAKLADYITIELETADIEHTFFQHIKRFKPAHIATIKQKTIDFKRYWSLSPPELLQLKTDQDYAEAMQHKLQQAVSRNIGNAGNIGSMLSGGMDSSAICAVANQQLLNQNKTLHTFSAISERTNPTCIESKSICTVINHLNLNNHTVNETEFTSMAEDLTTEFSNCYDLFDAHMMNVPLAVFKQAQKEDIDVMLDGVDGGMTIGYYGASPIRELLRTRKFLAVNNELKRLAEIWQISPLAALWKFVLRGVIKNYLPKPILDTYHQQQFRRQYKDLVTNSGINPKFAEAVDLPNRLQALNSSFTAYQTLPHAEQHAARIMHPTLLMAIERYERMARNHFIEARHPFLDLEFIQFCLSLPPKQKDNGKFNKIILRRAMVNILPEDITNRPYNRFDHLGSRFTFEWLKTNQQWVIETIKLQTEQIKEFIGLPNWFPENSSFDNPHHLNKIRCMLSLSLWLSHNNHD